MSVRRSALLCALIALAGCNGGAEAAGCRADVSPPPEEAAPPEEEAEEQEIVVPTVLDDEGTAEALGTPSKVPASPPDEAYLIVPGQRFGPVEASTTHEDLLRHYGAEQVQREDIHVGEGFTQPGSRVQTPEGTFSVIWATEGEGADQVRTEDPAWRTREGIGVGTSLAELREVAGAFRVAGFAWDYAGTVDLEPSTLEGGEALILRVEVEREERESSHYRALVGDRFFPADNPDLVALNPKVRSLIVRFRH